jgi:hypothetical protein
MATDAREKKFLEIIQEQIPDKNHAGYVISAVGPYVVARKQRLFQNMTEVLKDGIVSQRLELGAKWEAAMKTAIEAMGKTIERIPTARKILPEQLRQVEIGLANEEAQFVQAAGMLMGLGNKAREIIELGLNLTAKSEELLEVWAGLKRDMKDAEEAMSDAQQDIERTINEAIGTIAYNDKDAAEYAHDLAEILEKAPPGPILGEYTPFIKWVASLRNTHAVQIKLREKIWERESRLERFLAKRGVGVVMFTELRDAVKEFLEAVNVEKSVLAVKKIQEMIKQANDGCVTPEQKSDMAAFTKVLAELVEDAHEKMVSAHDKFVAKHSGIFFGAVSYETMRILLNGERWKKAAYEVRISQLNSALQKLYDFDYVTVPLRYYEGDQQSALRDHLHRTIGELYEDIKREASQMKMLPDKYENFLDSIEELDRQVD